MKKTYKYISGIILVLLVSASPLRAAGDIKIIDSMDSGSWNIAHSTPSMEAAYINTHPHEGIDYDFKFDETGAEWFAAYNEKIGYLDFSSGDAVSFYFKGEGSTNHIQLQVHDSTGNVFVRQVKGATLINDWQKFVVPFKSMTHWEDTGDGKLKDDEITQLKFEVVPQFGGNGNISIDNIQSYKLNTDSSTTVSSFDFGSPPNEMGGNEGTMSHEDVDDPAVVYDRNNVREDGGAYCLRLDYDISSQWCGYWIKLDAEGATVDISSYTHLNFWVKSENAGQNFKVEISDKDKATSVNIEDHLTGGTSTWWREVDIAISSFTPVVVSTAVKEVNFVFDSAPDSGTVFIDDIKFTSDTGTEAPGPVRNADPMELPSNISGWKPWADEGNTASLDDISGYKGPRAYRLNYSFGNGDWVVMERKWGLNLSTASHVSFEYRGSGASNNIELKLDDIDGTRFMRRFFSVTDTGGEWQKKIIPIDDFTLFEEGEEGQEELDLSSISKVDFAIVRREGEDKDVGKIYLRNLGLVFDSDFSISRRNKIIEKVEISDNPFAPGRDSINDYTRFSYSLSEEARVRLRIFSLNGKEIWQENAGRQDAGEHYIDWKGKDSSGDRVNNGMYFYMLSAEADSGSDEVKHLIAVIR